MKRILCVLVSVGLFSAVSNADAADKSGGLKLGFINFEVAFAQQQEAQKHNIDLQKEETSILESEQKARTEIEAKMAKLQEEMPKLAEKARNDRQTALGEEINKIQLQLNQRKVELNQKRQQVLADLETKNRLVVESVSRKEGLNLVLNSAAIVYATDEVKKNDITAKVVAEYNKAYPVKAEPAKKVPEKKPAPKKK